MDANTKLYLTRNGLEKLEEIIEAGLLYDDIGKVLDGLHYGPENVKQARYLSNYGMETKDPEYVTYDRWLKLVKKAINEGYVSTFEYQNAQTGRDWNQ